jgi:hypothetical protein
MIVTVLLRFGLFWDIFEDRKYSPRSTQRPQRTKDKKQKEKRKSSGLIFCVNSGNIDHSEGVLKALGEGQFLPYSGGFYLTLRDLWPIIYSSSRRGAKRKENENLKEGEEE